jgi:N-acetylneuraminic acid mutarotase
MRYATVVSLGDSFLLVGGHGGDLTPLSSIYRYNPEEDSWTLLNARLKKGKLIAIAMLVDRETFTMK